MALYSDTKLMWRFQFDISGVAFVRSTGRLHVLVTDYVLSEEMDKQCVLLTVNISERCGPCLHYLTIVVEQYDIELIWRCS